MRGHRARRCERGRRKKNPCALARRTSNVRYVSYESALVCVALESNRISLGAAGKASAIAHTARARVDRRTRMLLKYPYH